MKFDFHELPRCEYVTVELDMLNGKPSFPEIPENSAVRTLVTYRYGDEQKYCWLMDEYKQHLKTCGVKYWRPFETRIIKDEVSEDTTRSTREMIEGYFEDKDLQECLNSYLGDLDQFLDGEQIRFNSTMRLNSVELENFMPFDGSHVVKLDEGIWQISSEHEDDKDVSNRNGKTAFLESIAFVFFGKTSRGWSLDKHIFNGRDRSEVKLNIHVDGQNTNILRQLTNRGSKVNAFGKVGKAAQEEIENYLGVGYKDFFYSAFIQQRDLHGLLDEKSSKLFSVLSAWLGLSKWDDVANKVNGDLRSMEAKKKDLRSKVGILETLSEEPVENLWDKEEYAKYKKIVDGLRERISKVDNKILKTESLISKSESEIRKTNSIKRSLDCGRCPVDSCECPRDDFDLDKLDEVVRAEKDKIDELEKSKVQLRKKYNKMRSAETDRCEDMTRMHQSKISSESFSKMMSEYEDVCKQLEEIEPEIIKLKRVANAVGSTGIPADILSGVCLSLESSVNDFLSMMGKKYGMRIRYGVETKRLADECVCGYTFQKSTKEKTCQSCGLPRGKHKKLEFEIVVVDGDEEHAFNADSGGGRSILSLVFRVAISKMMGCPVLFLDEVDGALDSSSLDSLISFLEILAKDHFKQIFVVTHRKRMIDSFLNRIKIIRGNDRSWINVTHA